MKKIIVFFIITTLSWITLESQTPDCSDNDCYDNNNVPWTTETRTYYPDGVNCPNCYLIIYYRYRDSPLCPNEEGEFKMDGVILAGDCWGGCPYPNGDLRTAWIDALEFLIENNHVPIFAPPSGSSHPTTHITPNLKLAECVRKIDIGNDEDKIEPCGQTCCWIDVFYHTDSQGNFQTGGWDITEEGPGICHLNPGDCKSACVAGNPAKQTGKTEIKIKNNPKVSIHPNPNEGKFNISVNLDDDNYKIGEFSLVDITGNEVFRKSISLSQENNLYVGNLLKGSYLYIVRYGTNRTLTGKVIIK